MIAAALEKLEALGEVPKYLIVGGINFVFTFLVFVSLLKGLEVGYVLALLVSWLLGNILTYSLNFVWVFRPEAKLNYRSRFLKYLLAGSVSITLNVIALTALVELGGLDPFWSQVIVMPFIILFNFSTAKWWSLRKGTPRQ